MDVLTISNVFLKTSNRDSPATVKIADEGIAIKLPDQIITIKKTDLRDIDLFRGIRKVNLRVITDTVYDLNNVDENYIDRLKRAISTFYHLNIYLKDLEITDTLTGELCVNGQNMLEFRNTKTVFDLPVSSIEGVVDVKNEICITADDLELRFVTANVGEIKEMCNVQLEPEICVFENLSILYPRGKNNFVLFKDYFRMVGSTYDHKIYYKNVKRLYLLEKDYLSEESRYVILSVPGIRQGQTVYDFIVVGFNDWEEDFEIEGRSYTGLIWRTFVDVIKKKCEMDVVESVYQTRDNMRGIRCATKAYEGSLYPLDCELLFLPRAISMEVADISSVEFSRINLSAMQAKTFDMTVFGNSAVTFTGILKEEFGSLEHWFNERNVTVRSEVIDDIMSSEESISDADDSSIIAGDE